MGAELDGKDESVMAHYSLLTALPVLARCARKLAVQIGPPPPRRSRAWMAVQALAFIAAVSVLITMIVRAAVIESRQQVRCPAVTVDQDVLDHTQDFAICPLADTAVDVTGFRHTPIGERAVRDRVYAMPGLGTMVIPDEMVRAWHAQLHELGAPIDYPRHDGKMLFVNFERGHVAAESGYAHTVKWAKAVVGHRYEPVSKVGDCPMTDRPCVVVVERTADPDRTYGFSVAAFQKRFLGRSTCTPWYSVVVPAVRSLPGRASADAGHP